MHDGSRDSSTLRARRALQYKLNFSLYYTKTLSLIWTSPVHRATQHSINLQNIWSFERICVREDIASITMRKCKETSLLLRRHLRGAQEYHLLLQLRINKVLVVVIAAKSHASACWHCAFVAVSLSHVSPSHALGSQYLRPPRGNSTFNYYFPHI